MFSEELNHFIWSGCPTLNATNIIICKLLADPVMIIGAGLSAADAILNAQVHIFIKKCQFIYVGF
jgi:hypothetical protein